MCAITRCRLVVTILFFGLVLTAGALSAQTPAFVYSLDSVMASQGQQGVRMPVYLDNYEDTIGGFSLVFQVDRPGICSLRTTIDTTGCLIGGWPWITVNRLDANGYQLQVAAIHLSPLGIVDPLYPQSGGPPLFYLQFDVFSSLTIFDVGAAINLRTTPWEFLQMSDANANIIGAVWVQQPDTTCLQCLEWFGDPPACVSWELAPEGPCDSIAVISDSSLVVDTAEVRIAQQGWVQIVPMQCGDFDNSGDVNLTDLTLFVNFLFGTGSPTPVSYEAMDVYRPCLSGLTLTDLTVMVQALFLGGRPLDCCVIVP